MRHLVLVLITVTLLSSCKEQPKKTLEEKKQDYKIELGEVKLQSKFESDTMSIW